MAAAEASARPTRLPQPTLPVSPQIPAAFAAYAPPNCRLDFPLNPPIPTLRVDFHGADGTSDRPADDFASTMHDLTRHRPRRTLLFFRLAGSVISELRTSHGKCYRFVREICQVSRARAHSESFIYTLPLALRPPLPLPRPPLPSAYTFSRLPPRRRCKAR